MKVLSFLFWTFLLLIAAAIVLPVVTVGYIDRSFFWENSHIGSLPWSPINSRCHGW